jgi:hypothetical protein
MDIVRPPVFVVVILYLSSVTSTKGGEPLKVFSVHDHSNFTQAAVRRCWMN